MDPTQGTRSERDRRLVGLPVLRHDQAQSATGRLGSVTSNHSVTGSGRRRSRLPDVEPLPPMSPAERIARGHAARTRVPLAHHAWWEPGGDRPDPVAIIERQSAKRDPDLVPLRHGRMSASAFAFFRGGAAIMASDLSTTPVTGLRAQLCGDAHLGNFGLFETPERSAVFDINDFDETLPGPWEWDVKRLVVSVEVAGLDLGFSTAERQRAVVSCARAYRERMLELSEMGNLEVWHARLGADELLSRVIDDHDAKRSRKLEKQVRKGLQRNHLTAFEKLIDDTDGEPRFAHRPPLLVPIEELLSDRGRRRYVGVIREFLDQYRESLPPAHRALIDGYRYVHLARKVVGVGSVGTRALVVLMIGRDEADPLLLQLKEAKRSVLEPFCGLSQYRLKGQRVVEGQRLMQAASDPLLGWYRLQSLDDKVHDFYVRQLWDGKASVDVTYLSPPGLASYAEACGLTLARAHARSGYRISIAAYLGESDEFDQAVAQFAAAYASTNATDHTALVQAIESGQLPTAHDE
jgi:uncharacterized protein (DUF2252 family)